MLSLLIAAAAASVATASPAQPATPVTKASVGGSDQVCHTIKYLGSRLNSAKICKTKAEWNEIQAEHDRLVRQEQTRDRALDVH
jgi:hypothetical protein